MRNFMCIFLIVLLKQNVTRGLDCMKSEKEGDCIRKNQGSHEKTFSCLKELKEEKQKCTPVKNTCIHAIFTYVDNDTLTFKDCDAERDNFPRCKFLLHTFDTIAGKEVKDKDCVKCKTDFCNAKPKKVETTTILSKRDNTAAPSKEKNKSLQILPNMAVLIIVVISLMI